MTARFIVMNAEPDSGHDFINDLQRKTGGNPIGLLFFGNHPAIFIFLRQKRTPSCPFVVMQGYCRNNSGRNLPIFDDHPEKTYYFCIQKK